MKKFSIILALSLLLGGIANAGNPVKWPLDELYRTPGVTPMPSYDIGGIKAILIDGIDYKGEPTKFFAYYGLPEGASPDNPAPAMVLVHGGLGTAFWEWVKVWNELGYAAISMDTTGRLPIRLTNGLEYPAKGGWALLPGGLYLDWGGFERGLRDAEEQWPYCAVAEVIQSHSFLRSLPEVDATRIGLTGNSWGGFLTLLTAAVDKRYQFAAPVYACGFFEEMTAWNIHDAAGRRWCDLFDPMHYIPQIEVPILWAAGTNDFAFDFPTHQKSMALASVPSYKAIRLRMIHTDGKDKEGQPQETFALADHLLKGGPDLPVAGDAVIGKKGTAAFDYELNGRTIESIEFFYTTSDVTPWRDREWLVMNVPLPRKGNKASVKLPEGTTAFFFNVNTADGLTCSSTACMIK